MSRLNAPREIPYAFHVVAFDGEACLVDDSSRSYPCTAVPHVYFEPLYVLEPDDDEDIFELREPGLLLQRDYDHLPREPLLLDLGAEVSEGEAWDEAREAAHANHVM